MRAISAHITAGTQRKELCDPQECFVHTSIVTGKDQSEVNTTLSSNALKSYAGKTMLNAKYM